MSLRFLDLLVKNKTNKCENGHFIDQLFTKTIFSCSCDHHQHISQLTRWRIMVIPCYRQTYWNTRYSQKLVEHLWASLSETLPQVSSSCLTTEQPDTRSSQPSLLSWDLIAFRPVERTRRASPALQSWCVLWSNSCMKSNCNGAKLTKLKHVIGQNVTCSHNWGQYSYMSLHRTLRMLHVLMWKEQRTTQIHILWLLMGLFHKSPITFCVSACPTHLLIHHFHWLAYWLPAKVSTIRIFSL